MHNQKKLCNSNVGFKNLVIGFLLGLCVTLAIAAVGSNESGTGRYQCCAAGGDELAVFVVDTETGHTWRLSRTDNYDFGTPHTRKSIRQSITPLVD